MTTSEPVVAASPPALPLDPEPRRIAVFRALFLGDLLCATPALRALRRRFPAAEITLIGLPWAADLVARLPSLDHFESFPGFPGLPEVPDRPEATEAFLTRARAHGYDLTLQMHGSGRVSNGVAAALGARATLGYGAESDGRLTLALHWCDDEHETRRWLRLVAALGASTDDVRPEWPRTAAEDTRAAVLLAPATGAGPLIGFHPGAKEPARRWPPARFADLADALADRHGARVVLTGGPSERDLTATVRGAMRAPALDLAGATDLGAFAAVVARLDLLVTNDTGASHLAAAAGTPSVVLFGPSRPARWAPLDRARHRVVDALALADPAADPAAALATLPVSPVLGACLASLDAAPRFPGAEEIAASLPPPERSAAPTAPLELRCAV